MYWKFLIQIWNSGIAFDKKGRYFIIYPWTKFNKFYHHQIHLYVLDGVYWGMSGRKLWFGREDKDNDSDDHEDSLQFTIRLFELNGHQKFRLQFLPVMEYKQFTMGSVHIDLI